MPVKLADAAEEIYTGLLDLTREGGPGNFMVLSAGDVYVQFAGSPGNPKVLCESISNEYLPEKLRMTKVGLEKLKKMGFVLGGEKIQNFSRTYEVTTEDHAQKLAKTAIKILKEVYRLKPVSELQIEVSLE